MNTGSTSVDYIERIFDSQQRRKQIVKKIEICRDDEMRKTTIAEACTLHARIGWQGLTKK